MLRLAIKPWICAMILSAASCISGIARAQFRFTSFSIVESRSNAFPPCNDIPAFEGPQFTIVHHFSLFPLVV